MYCRKKESLVFDKIANYIGSDILISLYIKQRLIDTVYILVIKCTKIVFNP